MKLWMIHSSVSRQKSFLMKKLTKGLPGSEMGWCAKSLSLIQSCMMAMIFTVYMLAIILIIQSNWSAATGMERFMEFTRHTLFKEI
jgi:hypothetical protein